MGITRDIVTVLTQPLSDFIVGRWTRKPTKWLEKADEASVLEALRANLIDGGWGLQPAVTSNGPTKHFMKTTFGSYGFIHEADGKRYWSERDFGAFLKTQFADIQALHEAVPILWRSFYFYAYFPFSVGSEKQVDYAAFQRGVTLASSVANGRLGIDASGAYLTPRCDTVHVQLWRAFRSLAVQSRGKTKPEWFETQNRSAEMDDLLDVLALVQPGHLCMLTVQRERLSSYAQRIMPESCYKDALYPKEHIPREDFASLLKLLLSLQISEPKYDVNNRVVEPKYLAVSSNADPDRAILNGTLKSLMKTLGEEDGITWPAFKASMARYLPHLLYNYRMFLATILTPSSVLSSLAKQIPAPLSPAPILSTFHAQYLSFFLPCTTKANSKHYVDYQRHRLHYAFQSSNALYLATADQLSDIKLAKTLTLAKTQTLLLLAGTAINSTNSNDPFKDPPVRVVFGIYMPTLWDIDGEREYRARPGHVLFQLEPRLESFQMIGSNMWVMGLRKREPSDEEYSVWHFGFKNGKGMVLDFGNRVARLDGVANTTTVEVEKKRSFSDSEAAYGDINSYADWQTEMRIEKLEIYGLPGRISRPVHETLDPAVQSRRIQDFEPGGVRPVDDEYKSRCREGEETGTAEKT